MIGDSIEDDIIASENCNIKGILLDRNNKFPNYKKKNNFFGNIIRIYLKNVEFSKLCKIKRVRRLYDQIFYFKIQEFKLLVLY